MSSSSDSDEDTTTKQMLLDAVDPTLLTNALFDKSQTSQEPREDVKKVPKSQRFLSHENPNDVNDICVSNDLQNHLFIKMSDIINKQVDYYDHESNAINFICAKKHKSRLKLIRGAKHCVKAYEDVKVEDLGPRNKPEIKRLRLEDGMKMSMEKRLASVAQNPEDILSGVETRHWAKKQEREDKLFRYKMFRGTFFAEETCNEFSKLRRKNNWSEKKICHVQKAAQFNN